MNKTINLNDNYGRKLRDEIINENTNNGLKGEVEITVKNKETGKIESQQKHNLIVYGGREWLLKKAFNSNLTHENKSFIKNSEILWFGVGNGGGEPGNPLQCGCTYGSDNDLYNPVRLRYDFNKNTKSINPYYASRIMPNGDTVNGYYKRITYVNVKEDQANPYKKNNEICYPNLIAELRLEINSDDCCGQTYLNNDFEKSYSDINEAALFIADNRLLDPGYDDKLTYTSVDYTQFSTDRTDMAGMVQLPDHNSTTNEYTWNITKPFPNNAVQYFNVYKKIPADPTDYDYMDVHGYYKLVKLNNEPFLLGVYSYDGTSKCTGFIRFSDRKLSYSFNDSPVKSIDINDSSISNIDDLTILSVKTIAIDVKRSTKIENKAKCFCQYRNSYTTDFINITHPVNVFDVDTDKYRYFIPTGYVENDDYVFVEDTSFTEKSIIRVVQTCNVDEDIVIQEIQTDPNSIECRCYVDHATIKKIEEGMKIYTYNDDTSMNKISSESPATVNEIYDAESDTGIVGTTTKSYFTIERSGLHDELYTDTTKYPDGGLNTKLQSVIKDSPYIMFNRVTFSTIRVSKNRLVDLVWRIYF